VDLQFGIGCGLYYYFLSLVVRGRVRSRLMERALVLLVGVGESESERCKGEGLKLGWVFILLLDVLYGGLMIRRWLLKFVLDVSALSQYKLSRLDIRHSLLVCLHSLTSSVFLSV